MRTAPAGEAPFKHLIYPIPEEAGLGTHLTLGVAGDAKFGPDSQWIAWDPDEGPDYAVDPARCEKFYGGVRLHGSCCAELLRICLDSQFALGHAAMCLYGRNVAHAARCTAVPAGVAQRRFTSCSTPYTMLPLHGRHSCAEPHLSLQLLAPAAIRKYWPGLEDGQLEAGYSGIRPKLVGPGQPAADFVIQARSAPT